MNNKGFTTIELLVSFTLTVVVMSFLFEILLDLRDLYIGTNAKTNMLVKQTIISSKVNEDLTNKKIASITSCGTECIGIYFTDGMSKELSIDRNQKIFVYGDYTTTLVPGSTFGNVEVYSETYYTVENGVPNSILQIRIPITSSVYDDDDFGLHAIYQYDNRTYNLAEFDF